VRSVLGGYSNANRVFYRTVAQHDTFLPPANEGTKCKSALEHSEEYRRVLQRTLERLRETEAVISCR
jgi:hypothetical protein